MAQFGSYSAMISVPELSKFKTKEEIFLFFLSEQNNISTNVYYKNTNKQWIKVL